MFSQTLPDPPEIKPNPNIHISMEMTRILGLPENWYHYTEKDKKCLVTTLYWESLNKPEAVESILDVILNRFKGEGEFEGRYKSLSDVVLERCKRRGRTLKTYQFTGYRYYKRRMRNADKVTLITNIVEVTLNNINDINDLTNGAVYYHELHMHHKPKWTKRMVVTATIGNHYFYRPLDIE